MTHLNLRKLMKIFPVTLYCLFSDYLEKDYLALKISGDIKETMTYTLKWCKIKDQSLGMDRVKAAKTSNQATLWYLKQKELHHPKWDMLELCLLIADGRKEVNKDLMTTKVSCLLTLETQLPIQIMQSIKITWFKIKKTS